MKNKKFILTFLTLMVLAIKPIHAEETRLNDVEINEALNDQTALYVDGVIRQFFNSNGKTPYWDGHNTTYGSWKAIGNQYCSVWPPSQSSSCYNVYRDDQGRIVWTDNSGRRWVADLVEGNQLSTGQ